jgi:hypothetical protein
MTTNTASQTFEVTQTIAAMKTGGGSQPTAQPVSTPSSTSTGAVEDGAIAGGVVGGVAVLSLLGIFFFLGFRKGWFTKKHQYAPGSTPGIDAARY